MAKKDFGRRLMPEYLLKYSEELQKNHPDPSASWGGGGGGGDYTAGMGIDISNQGVISADIKEGSGIVVDEDLSDNSIVVMVDQESIPYKSDLKAVAFSGDYEDLTNKPTLFSGDYEDLTNKPDLSIYAESADLATVATTGSYTDLTDKPTIPTKTSDLQNDSGFITGVTWNDVTGKPTFATVATSGDYDDLLNKPTIPTVDYPVTDVQVDGVSVVSNKVASITMPTIPTVNDATITFTQGGTTKGTITLNQSSNQTIALDAGGGSVAWDDITNKPTFATVATSGSYNDLTDKPTIPTSTTVPFLGVTQTALGNVMFSTNGTNYFSSVSVSDDVRVNLKALNPNFGNGLSASFNSSTFALDVSIDTTVVALKSDIPSTSSFVDLTSAQTITGIKKFQSYLEVENTLYGIKMDIAPSRFTFDYDNQGTVERTQFNLPINKTAGTEQQPAQYTLATTDDIPSLSGYATETWVGQQGYLTSVSWNDVLNKPTFATVATSGSYTDLTDKPSIPSTASSTSTSTVTPTTQTLVFTLDDDSTVTVNVMTGATVATTTTTTLS